MDAFYDRYRDSFGTLTHHKFPGASKFISDRDALESQDVAKEVPRSTIVYERIKPACTNRKLTLSNPERPAVRIGHYDAHAFSCQAQYLLLDACGRGFRVLRQETVRFGSFHVGLVDARVQADYPVFRFYQEYPWFDLDDATRFAED